MVRFVLFSSILLLSTVAFPETSADNPPAQTRASLASRTGSETKISVARLKVPLKVRRLYEKAVNALLKHKPAEAQRKLDQALSLFPAFPEALTLSGALQLKDELWISAEQSLQAAIQNDPEYSQAYVVLAGVYNAERRFDDALQSAQRAASLDSRSWCVHYEWARALIGKGEYRLALNVSESALRREHDALLHLAKAHALAGLQSYPEAETELRTYLRSQPAGEGLEDARSLLNYVQHASPAAPPQPETPRSGPIGPL